MGEDSTWIRTISFAPRLGSGFITNGKLLKFSSPYPHGATKLRGAEISLDFKTLSPETNREKRIGELAIMYYYGRADDSFDQTDLPLGDNPLLDLIEFSASRDSKSHFLMAEWRWPLFSPVYQGKYFRFIQPQYSLGLGGIRVRTRVQEDNSLPVKNTQWAGIVTGSTQLRLMEVSMGPVDLSFEASVRMLAGQTFGIIGETAFRLTYQR